MLNIIEKRETSKEITIDDRCFIIESYDPMIGNYILMQLFTFILPMGIDGEFIKNTPGSENVIGKSQDRKMMGKEDFINLQRDILSTVYEKYITGEKSPVVRNNGTYGISDVSSKLFIKLIIQSLMFNFEDFFADVGLEGMFTNQ